MKRKREMRTCSPPTPRELTFFHSTLPSRKPQIFNHEFLRGASFCISWTIYHAVTHRAGVCRAGTSGCSNWEQDDMMSQSHLCVMRHPHSITKQLLAWVWISEDAAECWREENLSNGTVYCTHKIKINLVLWRYLYSRRIPVYAAPAPGVLVICLWNIISSVPEKTGPSEAGFSAGFISNGILNSISK